MHATWFDKGLVGNLRQSTLDLTHGAESRANTSYATYHPLTNHFFMNLSPGQKSGSLGAAGATQREQVIAAVRELDAAALLSSRGFNRSASGTPGQIEIVLQDRTSPTQAGANRSVGGTFDLNTKTEPVASAIRAIRDLFGDTL